MATEIEQGIAKNWKRPFFTIWTGQAISLVGSQLVQFALIWYLTRETGSAIVLTTATLVAMLPQVFIGPIAGSIVDRGNRRRILIVSDSAIALVTLVLALLFALGVAEIWHIYAMLLLRSLGGAFHSPSFTASTSLMVPKQHLARIQGMNQTLNGGLSIFSAPMGALLLAIMPLQGILAIDVVTALIAVGSLLVVAIPQPPREELAEGQAPTTIWQDMKEGMRYVLGWRGVLIILLMATLINFLLTPAFSLLPLVVTRHFNAGALELGWLQAGFGIGVVAGGLLLSIWGGFKRRIVTAMSGLVGLGLGVVVLGLAPGDALPLAIGGMVLAGVMQPITNGSLGAILQATVDPAMQGRVFTLVSTAATAISPLGLLIAGPLSEVLGIRTWYLVGGALCVVMGLFGFASRPVMTVEDGRSADSRLDAGADPGATLALDD